MARVHAITIPRGTEIGIRQSSLNGSFQTVQAGKNITVYNHIGSTHTHQIFSYGRYDIAIPNELFDEVD